MKYIEKLGLTKHTHDRKYHDDAELYLNWSPASGFDGDWWNPSAGLEGTYVSQFKTTWSYAKFENGTLYLKGLCH